MWPSISQKLKNDLYFSTCFAVLFTAYNTQSHIQKTLTVSIQRDDPNYTADGYVSFGVIYSFMSISMWISPAIIVILGRKMTLIIGALCYTTFVSFCYFETTLLTYLGSAITGIGAALLWTGQANYVVLNSDVGDVYRGITIFWILYEASYLTGNAVVYLQFNDSKKPIDRPMRGRIALILIGFVLLAIIMLCGLKPPIRKESPNKKIDNPLNEIKKACSIMAKKTTLILCISFVFIGMNMTFMSVMGASMGFSMYLSENSKKYAPLSGFVQGVGEIVGCCVSLFLTKVNISTSKLQPVFTLGCVGAIVGYVIAFLGLPDSAALTYTPQLPFIQLHVGYLLAANVLIGLADACLHIEIYQFLGILYPDDSAPAFAVFKFIRCLAVAVSFYYSNLMGLYMQLILLIIFSILGLVSYICFLGTVKSMTLRTKETTPPTQGSHLRSQDNKYRSYDSSPNGVTVSTTEA